MEAGKEYKIAPAGPSQISRIENGMLSYGSDMTLKENPYDVSLGKFVNLDKKADFLSKASLASIKQKGNNKKLVGVEIMGERFDYFVPDDLPIYADKKKIGKITSSIYSPRLNKNIGLAMLDTKINEDLKKITLKFNNKISEVQICSLPFLRNK